jgi:XTP/dITP diphosphohydrolase
MSVIPRILIATSNAGKLEDFSAAARAQGVNIETMPGLSSLPSVAEDVSTFEGNAQKKAEHYSRFIPGALVLADDSGLEVDALGGAPGVRSARYAAEASGAGNASDVANNARLLAELKDVPDEQRTARFVCVIAAARDGRRVGTFQGEAQGLILRAPRGSGGFGYDPLFFSPRLGKTFAELTAEQKAKVSHRGKAFGEFLRWYEAGV